MLDGAMEGAVADKRLAERGCGCRSDLIFAALSELGFRIDEPFVLCRSGSSATGAAIFQATLVICDSENRDNRAV